MNYRFGPNAPLDEIEQAIKCNREEYDFAYDPDFDLEVTPRPRWLGAVKHAGMCLAFVILVVLLCIAILLSPLVAIAAHLRGRMTP